MTSHSPEMSWPGRLLYAGAAVIAWALLNRAAAWFEIQPGLTYFFPAAAITVAAAARLGWLGVIAVTVANFVLPWGASTDLVRQALFALPAALWAGLVALIRRPSGATASRLWRFLGLGVFGGSLIAAVAGGALLAAVTGWTGWVDLGRTVALWWISDVTPALAFGLPIAAILSPQVLVDQGDLGAAREWVSRSPVVWRTVALGTGGALLLLAASTLLGAEVHWFVVALLPAVVAASVGGGVVAGLVAAGAVSAVYLSLVLLVGRTSPGDLVIVLSSTYANVCLFVAFALIAGVLSARNRQLVEHVRRQGDIMTRGLEETVEALAAAMHAKTHLDAGHLDRVARLSVAIGSEMGMGEDDLTTLRRAAYLHDVGQIGVPETILNTTADLGPAEQSLLRRHVELGVAILERVEFLGPVVALVRYSHERWDGKLEGPFAGHFGLRGEQIPLGARIIAAVETFDAFSFDRPYRPGQGPHAAIAELWRCSGSQFDPAVVAALTRVVGRERDLPSDER